MVLNQIDPTKESIKALVENHPKDQPVVMLNILRFKEKVENGSETGIEAYQRYSKGAIKHLHKTGAKVIWAGQVTSTVIGAKANQPHQILLVEYPTVNHFLGMVLTPEYQELSKDRTLALEYGGLISCVELSK